LTACLPIRISLEGISAISGLSLIFVLISPRKCPVTNKKGAIHGQNYPPSLEQELPSAVIVMIVASMVAFVVMTASGIAVFLIFVTIAPVLVVAIVKRLFPKILVKSSELSAEPVGDKLHPTSSVGSWSLVSGMRGGLGGKNACAQKYSH